MSWNSDNSKRKIMHKSAHFQEGQWDKFSSQRLTRGQIHLSHEGNISVYSVLYAAVRCFLQDSDQKRMSLNQFLSLTNWFHLEKSVIHCLSYLPSEWCVIRDDGFGKQNCWENRFARRIVVNKSFLTEQRKKILGPPEYVHKNLKTRFIVDKHSRHSLR